MRGLLRRLRRIIGSRWCAGLLLLILVILVGGGHASPDRLEELWKYYVTDFPGRQAVRALVLHGTGLPEVDEVRVFRIADDAAGSTGVRLDPPLLDTKKYVVNEHLLKGEEALTLAALWRGLGRDSGFSAGCYDPHHVIRFLNRGRKISEAFVCFQCGNATLPSFPKAVPVCFIGAGMQESPDYVHFRTLVEGYVGTHPKPTTQRKQVRQ